MTRNEFLYDITDWSDLLGFCSEYECDACSDIIDDLDYCVNSDLSDAIDDYGWEDIRDFLSGIRTDYSYYRRDGLLDYNPVDDDDFDAYKEDVLDWADNNDIFDEEEREQDEDAFENDGEETLSGEPNFAVTDLMNMCSSQYRTEISEREAAAVEEDARVAAFICSC